ncbi:YjbF family lipoprotein [Chromatiaceae bacterium AAb-1]|nr:YjbF family lipoprotein [Chromatiaceae bacterium AAb-1]
MIKPLLILLSAFLLTSCSGTYHSYYDTLKLAFNSNQDAELTLQQVRDAEYDLLYVRSGERAQAVMALAYIEYGQHKWISEDQALLVLEQGRIVKTTGFAQDLLYLTNTMDDPLKRPLNMQSGRKWLRLADWKHGEYGYQLRSEFQSAGNQPLVFFGKSIDSVLMIEAVEYLDQSNFLHFNRRWQNYFWFDAKTGALLKSKQLLAPFWHEIETTHISQIARLLDQQS